MKPEVGDVTLNPKTSCGAHQVTQGSEFRAAADSNMAQSLQGTAFWMAPQGLGFRV